MLHSIVAPPGLGELIGLVLYVLSDPHLLIGSTTVMTSAIVAGAAALSTVTAVGIAPRTIADPVERAVGWLAPKLALILVYFGLGSMILATEILIRFHRVDPDATETQFRSGIGHLAIAAMGISLLWPRLRRLSLLTWIDAHFWALGYLAFQVTVLTPPWFEYQFQGALVTAVARAILLVAFAMNVCSWMRVRT